MILCYYQLNDYLFVHNLAGFEDFPVTNKKCMCNVLRLDAMHASLPNFES